MTDHPPRFPRATVAGLLCVLAVLVLVLFVLADAAQATPAVQDLPASPPGGYAWLVPVNIACSGTAAMLALWIAWRAVLHGRMGKATLAAVAGVSTGWTGAVYAAVVLGWIDPGSAGAIYLRPMVPVQTLAPMVLAWVSQTDELREVARRLLQRHPAALDDTDQTPPAVDTP